MSNFVPNKVYMNEEEKITQDAVENQGVKSAKQTFVERMKSKNPEYNADDEEAMFGGINSDYDNYDKEIAGYKDREGKLVAMMEKDPRSSAFLAAWADGEDPVISLVKQFGTEIADAIDDPEKTEEIAAANKEYLDRVARSKQLEGDYNKNLQGTIDVLGKFQEENGYSEDEMDNGLQQLSTIVGDFIQGKIEPSTLALIFKANNYDTDMANAQRKGEVTGRNQRIKEMLRKPKGDGIGELTSKAAPAPGGDTMNESLGALNRYNPGTSTIEERGGMRRIKHG